MEVFVVMGNDYPAEVFDSEVAAKEYCEAKRNEPGAIDHRQKFGADRIYWRVYPFVLQQKVHA